MFSSFKQLQQMPPLGSARTMRTFDVEKLEDQPLNLAAPSSTYVPPEVGGAGANGASYKGESTLRSFGSKKVLVIVAAVAGVLVVALAIGLGVGLTSSDSDSKGVESSSLTKGCQEVEDKFWTHLQPEQYDIALQLDGAHFAFPALNPAQTFQGRAAITFNVSNPVSCVIMHADNLNFSSIAIDTEADGVKELCGSLEACKEVAVKINRQVAVPTSVDLNLIAIDLSGVSIELEPGTAPVLFFNYTGALGQYPAGAGGLGLHRSTPFTVCANPETQEGCKGRVLVSTQLERVGARRVFPAYDMPNVRSVFNLKVTAPSADAPVVLSNMPESSREDAPGLPDFVTVSFEPTPRMPAYLLGLTAGELESPVSAAVKTASGFTVKTWAPAGLEAQMADAQGLAEAALEHYSDFYTGVEQPIKKYDVVAVPGRTNAMENWGLLIMDAARVLYTAENSGGYARVRLVSVVCHEVGHQWVGNLMGIAQWNLLGTKEGLVTEEEYACMSKVDPQLPGDILRYRVVPPTNEIPDAHLGPLNLAMAISSDPLLPAACPASDLEFSASSRSSRLVYSKAAINFYMLKAAQLLLTALYPGDLYRDTLVNVMKAKSFSTFTLGDLFTESVVLVEPVIDEKVGPGKQVEEFPWAMLYLMRAKQVAAAGGDPDVEREMGFNGSAPAAAFLYAPLYAVLDARNPEAMVPNNVSQTLLNIGGTQTRYCAWTLTQEQGNGFGVDQKLIDLAISTCSAPSKVTNIINLVNLTDCEAGKEGAAISTVSGPINFGDVAQDKWVLNREAIRMWRTQYTETHFNNLVFETAGMATCPAELNTTAVKKETNVCCAGAGDMLEATGVLNDALTFAQDGTYPANWAMAMINASGSAPVTDSALGQYLMLYPAIEAIQTLYPYVAADSACSAKMASFAATLVKPRTTAIFDKAVNATKGELVGDELHEAFLQRMIMSPLLLFAALGVGEYVPPANGAAAAAPAGSPTEAPTPGGRRRLLQDAPPPPPGAAGNDTEVPTGAPPPPPVDTEAPAPGPDADAATPPPPQDAAPGGAPPPPPATDGEAPAPTPAPTPEPAPAPVTPASAGGAVELQRQLCELLPSTPLWTDFIGGVAPVGGKPIALEVRAAVYSVAAAMPEACSAVLEEEFAKTNSAKTASSVAVGVRLALRQCWEEATTHNEASRCLYALPYAQNATYFLTQPTDLSKPLALLARAVDRGVWMQTMRPWLITLIGRMSPQAWMGIVKEFSEGALWDQLGAQTSCVTMDVLRPPVTEEEREAMKQFVWGRGAACATAPGATDMSARAFGRIVQAEAVQEKNAAAICEFLGA